MNEKVKPNCQNCKFYQTGIGAVLKSGHIYYWEECSKGWGKPTPSGVFKNACQLWIKNSN